MYRCMAPDKVRRPFGAGRQRTTEKKSTSDIRSEAEYVRASIIGGNQRGRRKKYEREGCGRLTRRRLKRVFCAAAAAFASVSGSYRWRLLQSLWKTLNDAGSTTAVACANLQLPMALSEIIILVLRWELSMAVLKKHDTS